MFIFQFLMLVIPNGGQNLNVMKEMLMYKNVYLTWK